MKRFKIFTFALAFALALLPQALFAQTAAAELPATFFAKTISDKNGGYEVLGEYLVLVPDGFAMVVEGGCAYKAEWSCSEPDASGARAFSLRDHKGRALEGTLAGGVLEASYAGYDYVYEADGTGARILDLFPGRFGRNLPFVVDKAGLLTAEQRSTLEEQARAISENYRCNVHIVAVEDFAKYSYSESVETFAEEVRAGYNLGCGDGGDTVLLVMSMAGRDFDLCRYGDFAEKAIDSHANYKLLEGFLDDFRADDWYGGFCDYLSLCAQFAAKAAGGGSPSARGNPRFNAGSLVVSLVLGLIVALVSMFCAKSASRHKPAEKQEAGNYVARNGIEFTYRQDRYTYTSESRVYDPPQKPNGGHSASGHSHSSGKF